MCQSATLYQPFAEGCYGPGYEMPFHATKLCDDYGLDTMALATIMIWLLTCGYAGILTDENTGIPLSKVGSLEFMETLVRKISLREGFGDVLAQGVQHAAITMGPEAVEQLRPHVSKAGQPNVYDARLYINAALLHATEPKPPAPQLQEITRIVFKWLEWRGEEPHSYVSNEVARRIAARFWGSEAAADFSTIEGKALAAKMIQDRQYAKECLILCGFLWPIMDSEFTSNHVGDPSLEAQFLSAVTGRDMDELELNHIGERVFNLQRAIYARGGHRGVQDDRLPESWYTIPTTWDMPNPEMIVPSKGDGVVSKKGSVVDRLELEEMKQEYYQLRGWDMSTGLQTRAGLERLGLGEVAEDIEASGRSLA
jgi:aldehyde:ferredoxin oxidoreductase